MRILVFIFFLFINLVGFSQENVKVLSKEEILRIELDEALQNKDYVSAKVIIKELDELTRFVAYENSLMSKNGLVLEGMFGLSGLNINTPTSALNSSLKFGYKAYLGERKMYNPGMQVFTKLNAVYASKTIELFHVSLVNVGMVNSFDFGNNKGFEINLNLGMNIAISKPFLTGVDINPVLLYKYKKLSYGLEYSGIIYSSGSGILTLNSLNLVCGAKF